MKTSIKSNILDGRLRSIIKIFQIQTQLLKSLLCAINKNKHCVDVLNIYQIFAWNNTDHNAFI